MPINRTGFHYTGGMPLAPASVPRLPPPPPSRRKSAVLLLTLVLIVLAHLSVIEWLTHELQLILPPDADDEVVSIRLHATENEAAPPIPASRPAVPADVDHTEPVAAIPRAEPLGPATAQAEQAPSEAPSEAQTEATTEATTEAPTEAPNAAIEPATDVPADSLPSTNSAADSAAIDLPAADSAVATANAASSAPALFQRASPPPAALLSFSVFGVRNGRSTEGRGSMAWQTDGRRYTLTTEIGVLFFTLLKSRSEGDLGTLGIVPELYAEKRIGRSETHTHFHRERRQISFSASTAILPVQGGEQDRGSWIWQLAALGRGDPDKFEAGLVFEMVIAGSRNADRWRVYVNERERLDLPDGPVSAWRLSVIPGPDSVERQFDLWLAPERDWYPVRLWHEDRHGNRIDMQLRKITREAAAASAAN